MVVLATGSSVGLFVFVSAAIGVSVFSEFLACRESFLVSDGRIFARLSSEAVLIAVSAPLMMSVVTQSSVFFSLLSI